MKTIKNKEILVGADFAGYPLKEAVCEHLRKKGWEMHRLFAYSLVEEIMK